MLSSNNLSDLQNVTVDDCCDVALFVTCIRLLGNIPQRAKLTVFKML